MKQDCFLKCVKTQENVKTHEKTFETFKNGREKNVPYLKKKGKTVFILRMLISRQVNQKSA